jgi:hypothetical protein
LTQSPRRAHRTAPTSLSRSSLLCAVARALARPEASAIVVIHHARQGRRRGRIRRRHRHIALILLLLRFTGSTPSVSLLMIINQLLVRHLFTGGASRANALGPCQGTSDGWPSWSCCGGERSVGFSSHAFMTPHNRREKKSRVRNPKTRLPPCKNCTTMYSSLRETWEWSLNWSS